MGATFNLEDLVRHGDMPSYMVTDGDIPCTPEVEQNYTYLFNICNQVPVSAAIDALFACHRKRFDVQSSSSDQLSESR
jgi:hypothetical protein